jgi:hypothetical protein
MSGLPDAKEAKGGGKPRSKPRQQPAKPRKAAAAAAAAAQEEDDEMAEAEGRQLVVSQPARQRLPVCILCRSARPAVHERPGGQSGMYLVCLNLTVACS